MVSIYLIIRNCQTLSPKWLYPFFIPTSNVWEQLQLFYFLSSTWKYHSSLILAIVTTCKSKPLCFNFDFLDKLMMLSIFSCDYGPFVYFLLLSVVPVFCPFQMVFVHSLYVPYTSPLSDPCVGRLCLLW